MSDTLIQLTATAAGQVLHTIAVNWPFLLASIVIAAALKVFVDEQRVASLLQKHRRSGVVIATATAVGTPLCSCGTTAIVLGMMASMTPWAPIIAFMVASPLTSPQELFYSAALFGWPFAIAFFVASILLGLAGGAIAMFMERAGFFEGQSRVVARAVGEANVAATQRKLPLFGRELLANGRRLMLLFLAFAFVGYFLNGLIPQQWIAALFGSGQLHSVPLAATLGIPFYLNTDASLPLLRPMLDAGMSPGAALAFLITGAGTSIGAIAGAMTIARWRVIGTVIATLWVGAIVFGFTFDSLQGFLA
jgi:uncharacterized membrane protein YraQ (UPF0718 family)